MWSCDSCPAQVLYHDTAIYLPQLNWPPSNFNKHKDIQGLSGRWRNFKLTWLSSKSVNMFWLLSMCFHQFMSVWLDRAGLTWCWAIQVFNLCGGVLKATGVKRFLVFQSLAQIMFYSVITTVVGVIRVAEVIWGCECMTVIRVFVVTQGHLRSIAALRGQVVESPG